MPSFEAGLIAALIVIVCVAVTQAVDHADEPDCSAVTVPATDYFPPAEDDDVQGVEC